MTPAWKIKREARRLVGQAAGLPMELARSVFFRRWYDLVTSKSVRRTIGSIDDAPEMAVYVIYPSNGLQQSHIYALDEMRAQQIAPLVVSNLPLREEERETLAARCNLILERPNVGYDFGGYRDGILELASKLAGLDRLWILNDSCWMVPQPTSWFEDARRMGVDFVGAASNYGLPRPPVDRLQDVGWTYSASHRNYHHASFALGIAQAVLRNPSFLRFWSKLDIRDSKKQTVRRGEIGLTQWVLGAGYSHGSTSREDSLKASLQDHDDAALDRIAAEIVVLADPRLWALRDVAFRHDRSSPEGRRERLNYVLTAIARQGSAYALAGYNLDRGFQFLKKSPMWLSENSARTMTTIIGRIGGPVGDVIRAEAAALKQARSSTSVAHHPLAAGRSRIQPAQDQGTSRL